MNYITSLILYQIEQKIYETTRLHMNRLPLYTITILIPALNEEHTIYQTLQSIEEQDYKGKIIVIVINNNSTDQTVNKVKQAMSDINIPIKLLNESKKGKNYALNLGLSHVRTKYFVTLDADTTLHKSAIQAIVDRMLISNVSTNIVAVAGCVLVKNVHDNLLTRLQKYDYLYSITGIKRMQSLYQSILVAQGAFSLYRTKVVKTLGGWDDCIGEDIVLTWKMLEKNLGVLLEPKAVCFTNVPKTVKSFVKQRSRWARGMFEAIKKVSPFKQGNRYSKYLTSIDLIIPLIDLSYVLFFVPGVILACFGYTYIVGYLTLLVLPLVVFSDYLIHRLGKKEIYALGISAHFRLWDFILFLILYQTLSSITSIIGYLQELFHLKRRWK